jgi:hypothetical protein
MAKALRRTSLSGIPVRTLARKPSIISSIWKLLCTAIDDAASQPPICA